MGNQLREYREQEIKQLNNLNRKIKAHESELLAGETVVVAIDVAGFFVGFCPGLQGLKIPLKVGASLGEYMIKITRNAFDHIDKKHLDKIREQQRAHERKWQFFEKLRGCGKEEQTKGCQ